MSSLSVTLIQPDLQWEDKLSNLKMLEEKICAIKEKTEVVILPEMFSTGFSMQPERLAETITGNTVQWMKKISREKKIILTGSLIIEESGKYFNRLIWMMPNGQFGSYDKRHCFAYAGEDQHYAAGDKRLIASVKGWRINLQVCYDLRFPIWARQQLVTLNSTALGPTGLAGSTSLTGPTALEYDLLIYVANWPERRNHAWKTLLQARAIENQCYAIGVNRVGNDGNQIYYSGDSMIVGPLGELIYQKTGEEDVFTFLLTKERLEAVRSKYPFWRDADQFHILINNQPAV
jgi:predicted amidohydrolase